MSSSPFPRESKVNFLIYLPTLHVVERKNGEREREILPRREINREDVSLQTFDDRRKEA